MISSVTLREIIRGSDIAAVFIPGLYDLLQVVDNQLANAIQLFGGVSIIIRQRDGFEPELARIAIPTDMDMPRLITVEAVKEKTIRSRNS
jgi:hypothetical protein